LRLRPGQPADFILACHTNFVLNRGIPQGVETALLCMNVLALIAVCLSIGFPAGKFVRSFGVQNAIVNTVSLGSSFLCGVFVQQELLGETVPSIARFLSAYWYVKAVDISGTWFHSTFAVLCLPSTAC
jgi:hypothetical protein